MRILKREVGRDCVEGVKQDVEDGIPVCRGINRALASAEHGLESQRKKALQSLVSQRLLSQRGAHNRVAAHVDANQVLCHVGRHPQAYPGED